MSRLVLPPLPAERRSAEEFARLLDGGSAARVDPSLVGLAELTSLFGAVGLPVPDAPFRDALRSRLLDQAAVELAAGRLGTATPAPAAPAPAARPVSRPGGQRLRRQLAAGGVALTLVAGTGALVSQGALPGDDLYQLKRSVESVELSITRSNHARGLKLLDQTDTRTREVQRLLSTDESQDPEAVRQSAEALDDAVSSLREGRALLAKALAAGDQNAIRELDEFLVGQQQLLAKLVSVVPASLRARLDQLTDEVNAAAEQVREGRERCGEACNAVPGAAAPPPGEPASPSVPVSSVAASGDRTEPKPLREARAAGSTAGDVSGDAVAAVAAGGGSAGTPSHPTANDTGRPNFVASPGAGSGGLSTPVTSGPSTGAGTGSGSTGPKSDGKGDSKTDDRPPTSVTPAAPVKAPPPAAADGSAPAPGAVPAVPAATPPASTVPGPGSGPTPAPGVPAVPAVPVVPSVSLPAPVPSWAPEMVPGRDPVRGPDPLPGHAGKSEDKPKNNAEKPPDEEGKPKVKEDKPKKGINVEVLVDTVELGLLENNIFTALSDPALPGLHAQR